MNGTAIQRATGGQGIQAAARQGQKKMVAIVVGEFLAKIRDIAFWELYLSRFSLGCSLNTK
jgi:hypothetical protein